VTTWVDVSDPTTSWVDQYNPEAEIARYVAIGYVLVGYVNETTTAEIWVAQSTGTTSWA